MTRTADQAYVRDGYYAYIDGGPKPSIVVIQDLDDERGYGSFWGEVNSNIHKGLGCDAVITNGSVRDLPDIAEGFQMLADRVGPSHAFVHVVDYSRPVTVAGMRVSDGDVIHADQHGAVVIPHEVCGDIKRGGQPDRSSRTCGDHCRPAARLRRRGSTKSSTPKRPTSELVERQPLWQDERPFEWCADRRDERNDRSDGNCRPHCGVSD